MVVEAQHFVGLRHHQMQIMRDHQYGAIEFTAKLVDKVIQCDLTIDIHTLSGFIQHQQLWFIQQCASQQDALRFPAGQFCIGASIRCPA